MNAAVLKNSALTTLTSRTSPDDCRVNRVRLPVGVLPGVAAMERKPSIPELATAPGCRLSAAIPRHPRSRRPRQYSHATNARTDDPLHEALRLIDLAAARGLQLRLMGGLAFHARVPDWTARADRAGRDIDLATRSQDRKGVSELLIGEGYEPDRQYNALYGHKQLY